MAAAKTELSLADLEKLIVERQSQVEALLKKREAVEKNIANLDDEIQNFMAGGVGKRASRKRPKNELSLRAVVLELLGKNKKGLSLEDLAEHVRATGYKSQARNFKNVVYQCLYNTEAIVHDAATGSYRVKR